MEANKEVVTVTKNISMLPQCVQIIVSLSQLHLRPKNSETWLLLTSPLRTYIPMWINMVNRELSCCLRGNCKI